MSEALQKLTAEDIKVEFSSVETFEQNAIFVEINEKCFGSYVRFKSPKAVPTLGQDKLEGIVVAIFPLAGTKTLTTLLSRRFLKTANKKNIDNKLKLSAFKEAANILVLTYINGIANALKVKIEMSIPKFACFHNSVEFMKRASLRGNPKPKDMGSVGQFKITREIKDRPPIKGRFIIVF
jgi:chemotaxis protein CheY-P-specific phosphatase CheC